jgi:hypothetical protein
VRTKVIKSNQALSCVFPVVAFAAKRCLPSLGPVPTLRWDAMASLQLGSTCSLLGCAAARSGSGSLSLLCVLIPSSMSAVAQLRCFETYAQFKPCASRRLNGYADGHVGFYIELYFAFWC